MFTSQGNGVVDDASGVTSPDLAALDAALLQLRRFAAPPAAHAVRGTEGPVETSTILVVDATARLAEANEPATVGAVAREIAVTHSTASRLVGRAVDAGMIVRERSHRDARAVSLAVTPAGVELQLRSQEFRLARLRDLLGDWEDDATRQLIESIGALAEAVNDSAYPSKEIPS
ncbi:MarR family winged helix-turn-helix transcriptional regulator [Demequina aurantiaca]|uniref:MarR family winged helix-turn-helix transcriptional regulator n=1 Tax=Demequina aurantiaca TaxID=676200 RepID=UPI00078225E6|nr:MarR family winged helix-turn-helix transcriptional regulator [Demequina aurantiaca]